MSDRAMDQIRGANPFPDELSAPPIETVLRRLDGAEGDRPAARRRLRLPSAGGVIAAISSVSAVAIAVVAIALLGHHQDASRATQASHPATLPGTANARVEASISDAVLGYLAPRAGPDFAAGQSLVVFARAVDTKAETACLAADGLPGPPVVSSPDGRFGSEEMPNLPLIRRTLSLGLTESYPGPTDPAGSLPRSRQAAYRAALARCVAAAPRMLVFLEGRAANAMFEEWMTNDFPAITGSPAVHAANRRASACSRSTGFAAGSVGGEVSAIEAKLPRLILTGHGAQASAVQASGVRVLVRCFGPVVALEDRLLAALRIQFVAAHAEAVRQIEHEAELVIPAAEARYGVRFDGSATGSH
jgi:hypothetical protein